LKIRFTGTFTSTRPVLLTALCQFNKEEEYDDDDGEKLTKQCFE